MSGTVRIPITVEMSSIAGARAVEYAEIPREEWEAMTPEEREDEVEAQAQTIVENHISVGWSLDEAEDE